jgi:RNA 3'-terminal phosphate cyclase (ATP)
MIHIDGSLGEGGGQVLRSALALALLTRQPVHITAIRARRPKPGLQPQHLAAVRAATEISAAQVEGAAIGSSDLIFAPGPVRPGEYRFDIGTAGSTSLVLQAIYLPLAFASGPSEIMLIGGTHVPWSPCFHYLDLQWRPYIERMGLELGLEMELAGFYPQGNGQVRARIEPVTRPRPVRMCQGRLVPLHLTERGALKGIRGISAVANLDISIAERQRNQALRRLRGRHSRIEIELLDLPSRVKGTFLLLLAEFKHTTACYFSLGALGKRAEQVADEACLWLEKFLATNGAIDEYLADQLLLPLAFADGPSEYRTAKVTQHLVTNAEVIRACMPVRIEIHGEPGRPGLVRVEGGAGPAFANR